MSSGVMTDEAVSLTIDGELTQTTAAQGTLTMDTNPTDGDTMTVGSKTYTFKGPLVAGVAAQGTLTMDTNPTDGDTMTIGAKTYTFQDTLTDVDGNIQIAAGNLATTQANTVAAINLTGTPGTDYAASMTIHPTVSAGAFAANDAVLTAKTAGTAGNSIATTETFTAGTNVFDAATLGTTRLGTGDSTAKMAMASKGQLTRMFGAVGTAPTGSNILVDALINGTTCFTDQARRVSIAAGEFTAESGLLQVTDFEVGDILTIVVEAIGSGDAGSDLTITMSYSGDTTP